MAQTTIDRLIINSPYEEPAQHWRYERVSRTFELVEGRRPAGYVVASGDSRAFDDPGIFVEIPLVNRIRPRVKAWREAGLPTPPVLITVCNRTETAARVKHAFDSRRIHIDELCQPEGILPIDSKVLDEAEAQEEPSAPAEAPEADGEAETDGEPAGPKLTKAEQAELLRRTVDTMGKAGRPGEKIQNVISVGMLSEGWDAKTVTHIMGLRAFTSQLLCEQVVGRGLRRTSYQVNPQTGLFEPEYVNIFGVPFTFLPHEGGEDGPPPPPTPKSAVEPDPAKAEFEIRWPNVVRI